MPSSLSWLLSLDNEVLVGLDVTGMLSHLARQEGPSAVGCLRVAVIGLPSVLLPL